MLNLFRHSILYTFANQVPALANLFLLPFITPFLKPEDYAIYGLSTSYIGLIGAFATLGLIMHFQNSYFKNKSTYKQEWSEMIGFLVWWRIIYSVLVFVILWFVFRYRMSLENFILICFFVVTPILFFDLIKTIGPRFFQYQQKHQYVYTSTLIASFLNIVVSFSLIYFYKLGYVGWFAGAFCASLFQFIYFSYYLILKNNFKILLVFNWKNIRTKLKTSIPLIPHSYSGYIMNSADRMILDLNKVDLNNIGLYNVAYSFSNYFSIFNNSTNTVLTPVYYKLFAKEKEGENNIDEKIMSITEAWYCITLLLACFISLWTKEIFTLLYRNPNISEAYYFVNFLLFASVYRSYYTAIVDKNIFYENSKSILLITITSALLAILINIIFIPFYGIKAAVAATFVSYIIMGFVGYYYKPLNKIFKINNNPVLFVLILIIVAICFQYLQQMSFIVKLGVSLLLVISGLIYYHTRGYTAIKYLKQYM